MNRYISLIKYCLSLFAVLLLNGCAKDDIRPVPTVGADEPSISFKVEIPDARIPEVTSRGMADNGKEDAVSELDIVVYDASVQTPVFLQRIMLDAGSFTQNSTNVTFKAPLQSQNKKVHILVIANARARLNQLGATVFAAGKTKKQLLEGMLITTAGTTPDEWKWKTGDPYTPIPMYGEIELNEITPTMGLIDGGTNGFYLKRMAARIDVKNSAANFTLDTIYLVNHYIAGYVSPGWDTYGNITTDYSPSPSATYKKKTADQAIVYAPLSNNYEGEIYTYESPAADDSNETTRKEATCLVIKGKYNGSSYFYRVDFTDTNRNYMRLLRNYKYVVNITRVDGIGYPDLATAMASYTMISNLKTNIISYDRSKISNTVFNGQYMLGAATDTVKFHLGEIVQGHDMPVFTNCPGGWEASIIESEGSAGFTIVRYNPGPWGEWEVLETVTGTGNNDAAQVRLRTVAMTAPGTREAKLRITSADKRLELIVNLKQTYSTLATDTPTLVLLDKDGRELPKLNGDYIMRFGLYSDEGEVPPQRIYVKKTGAVNTRVYVNPYANFTGPYISYAANNTIPMTETRTGTAWIRPNNNNTTMDIVGFDIVPTARSSGEINMEFKDMLQFRTMSIPGVTGDYSTLKTVNLRITQGDWIVISDIKDQILGSMAANVTIKANSPWEIVDVIETRTDTNGPEFSTTSRNLLAADWNSTVLGNISANTFLGIGATGGTGASPSASISNSFYLLTEKWVRNRAGTVTVVFRSTLDSNNYPDVPITFNVSETHLDYTVSATKAPMFYVFPVSFRNSTPTGDYDAALKDTWQNADRRCRSIGEGWRLPSQSENMLMYIYRGALGNTSYVGSGTNSGHVSWWGHYWSLGNYRNQIGTNGKNHASVDMGNGYTSSAKNEDALMYRCIYTKWPSTEVDPTYNSGINFPNSGINDRYYPYVTSGDANGPIIVSRETNGTGVNPATVGPSFDDEGLGLFTDWEGHNKVAAKLQIYPVDMNNMTSGGLVNRTAAMARCRTLGNEWRLPTIREMLLITSLGGATISSTYDTKGFAPLEVMPGSFTKLGGENRYWTSTYTTTLVDNPGATPATRYKGMVFGPTRWESMAEDPTFAGTRVETDQEGNKATYYIGAVRCVREQ